MKFLGWYKDPQHTFIATEYTEYGDLGTYIKTARPITEVKEITRQILEGLVVLHSNNIYGCDLNLEVRVPWASG